MAEAFDARGKALENQFFRAVDQALIERMQEEIADENARQKLSEATGITNNPLLDELMESGIQTPSLVAFALLPLAQVAWADGQVDEEEKKVVFNTAAALGCQPDSSGWALLNGWLEQQPSDELWQTWLDFASHVENGLSQLSRGELITTIVHRAKAVAEATGGVLGVHKTSHAEQKVIRVIESAFTG